MKWRNDKKESGFKKPKLLDAKKCVYEQKQSIRLFPPIFCKFYESSIIVTKCKWCLKGYFCIIYEMVRKSAALNSPTGISMLIPQWVKEGNRVSAPGPK